MPDIDKPPTRFSKAAKDAWPQVPEAVKRDIHHAIQLMEAGIEKYRGDAAEFDKVRHFAEMAQGAGTDLATALGKYTGIEQALRRDLVAGLDAIVQNSGIRKFDGTPLTLFDVASKLVGGKHDAQIAELREQVNELHEEHARLLALVNRPPLVRAMINADGY